MANTFLDEAGVTTLWQKICSVFVSKESLVDAVYPVGSIYMSISNTSPETLFGGTWEKIQDTFLLAAGQSYSLGSTGGESTHTLTIEEMPSHNHEFNTTLHWSSPSGVQSSFKCGTTANAGQMDLNTEYVGGGAAPQQHATLFSG